MSAKCIDCVRQLGLTVAFLSVLSKSLVELMAQIFIDDNNQSVSAPSQDSTGEELFPRAQQAADTWEGTLRATGGAINQEKSYFYMLDYSWVPATFSWVYRSIADLPGSLWIRDKDGSRKAMIRKEPDTADRWLGFWPAPDGNSTQQLEYLMTKVTDFTHKVRSAGKTLANDVWKVSKMTIHKTLDYPMKATRLTFAEWDSVAIRLWHTILPRSGFSRSFPRAVLYAPHKFQGRGEIHPWMRQELTHHRTYLEKLTHVDTTGELLMMQMEQLRLELGTNQSLTDLPYNTWESTTTFCWIKTLWESAQQFNLSFDDTVPRFETRRLNDHFLMDLFAAHGYSSTTLQRLNVVRMYMRVLTVGDICTADGKKLRVQSFNAVPTETHLHQYE